MAKIIISIQCLKCSTEHEIINTIDDRIIEFNNWYCNNCMQNTKPIVTKIELEGD